MNSILTVTTAADSQDLVSLAAAKTDLGISGTSEDARLSAWISQASGMIATECNRVFGLETLSEKFRPTTSAERLILSRYPISTITSVTEDTTVVDADDYEADNEPGLLFRLISDSRTCWTAAKIVVVYTAGYSLPTGVPEGLKRACLSLVKLMRAQATRDPLAKRIEIPDVMTTDYWVGSMGENGAMPPDVLDLIAPYKNWRV